MRFQYIGYFFDMLIKRMKKFFAILFLFAVISAVIRVNLLSADEIGYASYYSYECADNPMANGKVFDPEKRTCASWFYDFGTILVIKSLDTGLTTEVVVTDRGPNKRFVREGRIIDLSKRAFQDICKLEEGLTKVIIKPKLGK